MKTPTPQPPHWAEKLLQWLAADHVSEELQGDLQELFEKRLQSHGPQKARLFYILDVAKLLHPRLWKPQPTTYSQANYLSMFSYYLTIALRQLQRYKAFALLNILGLAIGLATCLTMLLYVLDETGYDRYSQHWNRMVRITLTKTQEGNQVHWPVTGPAMAADLKREYPEVLKATRMRKYSSPYISFENRQFKESRFVAVDANFFELFTLPFLEGEAATALNEPGSIVITEDIARKYFGNQEAIGKVLTLPDWGQSFMVKGIIKEMPRKSHFHADLFIPLTNIKESAINSWFYFEYYTYLLLPEDYDYKELEAKLPGAADKYMATDTQDFFGMSLKSLRQRGDGFDFHLQPLKDIHLHSSHLAFDAGTNGSIESVYLFSATALFMLLIACINFMNLSTAAAARRAREVGIRKVLGSQRGALIRQFLSESLLITVFAFLLSVGLLWLSLPFFNHLSGKAISFNTLTDPIIMGGVLITVVVVGLLAGSYPAFYLSASRPTAVLKGQVVKGYQGARLRSTLVVMQFFISTTLVICTLVVYKQLSYIQTKELGYDKEQVLVLHHTHSLGKNEKVYQQKLMQLPGVVNTAISGFIPAGSTNTGNEIFGVAGNPQASLSTGIYRVDEAYIPTLGMKLLQGRNFSSALATDSSAVILNQTAARQIGIKDIIGRKLTQVIDAQGNIKQYTIIGIVEDFHFESLGQKIRPLALLPYGNSGNILLKVQPTHVATLLSKLQEEWEAFSPKEPFTYTFLSERFEVMYEKEQKTGQALLLFTGLTIFIACLGPVSLSTFMALGRRKEIGIRKVLGATTAEITLLLSGKFIWLIVFSNLLAWPVAWYGMHQWLGNFAYRTDINPGVFLLAFAVSLIFTLLTVSYQSIRAALANPVESLKQE